MTSPQLILGPITGGLTANSANLWGRADRPAILYCWITQSPDFSNTQLAGQTNLIEDEGCAGVIPVKNLSPGTKFFYAFSFSPEPPHPSPESIASFTTFSEDFDLHPISFAFGSCFLPASANGGYIFRSIDRLRETQDLQFILLLGDQIYADDWSRNGIGRIAGNLEDYRAVYGYTWSRPPFAEMARNLPFFTILDDHEVDDDWHWDDLDRRWAHIPWWDAAIRWLSGRPKSERHLDLSRVRDALQAYREHQGIHAPAYLRPPSLNRVGRYALQHDEGNLAYSFTAGSVAFFVLDTRTMRVEGKKTRQIIDENQWSALEQWMNDVRDKFPVKFIVSSSSILFDMWLDIARDRWNGFPKDRERLLNLIARGSDNLFVLTGDLHSAHAISADLQAPDGFPVRLWEFCSTPFEQQPNKLGFSYRRVRHPFIRQSKLHFTSAENNFGVVRITFNSQGRAEVTFTIHDSMGKPIHSVYAK
jgi:phosphodiesterase/alkaline phosphatase D-like protein